MSIRKKLETILETKAFDQLVAYAEPASWTSMTTNERELLGLLFVKQGEHQLQQGDSKVLESFEIATKVAPQSPAIYYRQALVYAAQGQNIRCLKAAEAALDKATQLDPSFIPAWHSWGNILVRIGVFTNDLIYFQQADEKFAEAERLSSQAGKYIDSLYWHWGVCWSHLGKHSGEAVDFFCSLEKFRKGEELGFEIGEFHNDYGNILIDLACLLGKEELFVEAADHYEKATSLTPSNYESWLNLSCTYQRLYDFTGSRDYFHKADECFERTSEMHQDDPVIWLRWAELYSNAGKNSRDVQRLQQSFEKFKKSDEIEPGNPFVMLRWSEAQMLAASYSENLEQLRDAEAKIGMVLKALPHLPEAWYLYGLCLGELGRYFAADEYYSKAIEKFNRGLELKGAHPSLIHGKALAYYSIGELNSDVAAIEKALEHFAEVSEAGKRVLPQVLNDWGVALMKLGEMTNERAPVEEAALKFEEAINGRLDGFEGDDIELEWLYNYGCAMDFLGDFHDEPVYYEKAIQVLMHVLKIDPEYIHARYNLALALSHLGELNSDIECFHQALEQFHEVVVHDSEDEITWNDYGLALLNLAVLTADSVKNERSQDLFSQAEAKLLHATHLGSLHAYYNLGCLYALTNNPAAAIHYLEKAENSGALPPSDDVIHDEWLDNLRDQPSYRSLISRLLNQLEEDDSEF